MSKIIPGTFTRYELTEVEMLNGTILNEMQLQRLRNHLADIADQILLLEFDSESPKKFMQDDAHLKGQLGFIRFLIDSSEEATKALQELSFRSAQ